MRTRLVNVDRNTTMLLPPDLREWVAADDMVHFVIEAVEGLELPTLKVLAVLLGKRHTFWCRAPVRTRL